MPRYSLTGDDILTIFIGRWYYRTYRYYRPALPWSKATTCSSSKITRENVYIHECLLSGSCALIGQAWVSPTPVHSMSSFVCTVCTSIHCGQLGWLSWSLVSCAVTATTCAYYLPHSVSFVKQVCPTVRLHLCDASWGRGKDGCWDLGRKSHYNVLHLPSIWNTECIHVHWKCVTVLASSLKWLLLTCSCSCSCYQHKLGNFFQLDALGWEWRKCKIDQYFSYACYARTLDMHHWRSKVIGVVPTFPFWLLVSVVQQPGSSSPPSLFCGCHLYT